MLHRIRNNMPGLTVKLILFIFVLCLTPQVIAASDSKLQGKRIAMIVGISGYDTSELFEPKKMFESHGGKVDVVATEMGEAISGAGVSTKIDIVIDSLNVGDYDAIVFVGGSGAGYYYDHAKAHTIAQETLKQKKILGSICAASTILANAEVLKGKEATGYYKEPIIESGGTYSSKFVVRDGNLITAIGPNVVKEFAEEIILALQ